MMKSEAFNAEAQRCEEMRRDNNFLLRQLCGPLRSLRLCVSASLR